MSAWPECKCGAPVQLHSPQERRRCNAVDWRALTKRHGGRRYGAAFRGAAWPGEGKGRVWVSEQRPWVEPAGTQLDMLFGGAQAGDGRHARGAGATRRELAWYGRRLDRLEGREDEGPPPRGFRPVRGY